MIRFYLWMSALVGSSNIDESKFRFSHQRALQQQNFPAPPSSLITLEWDSEPRAKHGKASRDKDAFKKAFQRGLKLRRRRTMQVVM